MCKSSGRPFFSSVAHAETRQNPPPPPHTHAHPSSGVVSRRVVDVSLVVVFLSPCLRVPRRVGISLHSRPGGGPVTEPLAEGAGPITLLG